MESEMKLHYLILTFLLFSATLNPNLLTAATENKIIDNYLRGETFEQSPLFQVESRVYRRKMVDGQELVVAKTGDILEVLRMDKIFWIVRTKDGLIYCEFANELKIIDDEKYYKILHGNKTDELPSLPSYITSPNCSVPSIKDLLKAPYLINRWIENGCINPEELINVIDPIVKDIPAKKIESNINGYDLLSRLSPSNEQYLKKKKYYENRKKILSDEKAQAKQKKAQAKQEEIERVRKEMRASGYILEIDTWNWGINHGYAEVVGVVRNISDVKLSGIKAVVSWFTEGGDFITSSTALIEYTTLMPDQASPFKVLESANPLMEKAKLEFKNITGNRVATYKKQN